MFTEFKQSRGDNSTPQAAGLLKDNLFSQSNLWSLGYKIGPFHHYVDLRVTEKITL